MDAVLGLNEYVCDSRTELGCEGRGVMNAVLGLLGLTEFVCDCMQSWTELSCEGRVMDAVLGLKRLDRHILNEKTIHIM